jgi:hypothetical protein
MFLRLRRKYSMKGWREMFWECAVDLRRVKQAFITSGFSERQMWESVSGSTFSLSYDFCFLLYWRFLV